MYYLAECSIYSFSIQTKAKVSSPVCADLMLALVKTGLFVLLGVKYHHSVFKSAQCTNCYVFSNAVRVCAEYLLAHTVIALALIITAALRTVVSQQGLRDRAAPELVPFISSSFADSLMQNVSFKLAR